MSQVNDQLIYLQNVRLSFPHLVEPHVPKEQPNAKPKFSGDFIMAPNHPAIAQLMQRLGQLAVNAWGEHANAVMALIQQDRRNRCYGQGEEKIDKKTFQPLKGYAGNVYLTANNDRQPQMIALDGQPVDPTNTMAAMALARKLYGGCYVNVAVKPWAQNNTFGRAFRCDLVAIQFAADGEAFGEGSMDVTGVFGAVAEQAAAQPVLQGGVMPAAPSFGAPAAAAPIFGGIPGATAPQAAPGALPTFMTPQA